MKKILTSLLTFFLISNIVNAKNEDNQFFIGIKNTTGKSFYNQFSNNNKQKTGKYLNGITNLSSITFGGVISNLNISSGIGFALFNQNVDLSYLTPSNPGDVAYYEDQKYKYQFITMPFELNYRINLLKKKLYLNIGTGVNANLILKYEFIYPKNSGITILSKNPMNTKDIAEFSHIISMSVDTRLGFLYNINKKLDIYSNFEYSNIITGIIKPYNSTIGYNLKPYLLGGSIGLNLKLK